MFAKLAILCVVLFSFSAAAENEPIRFKNMQAASSWFSKNYPEHETRKYVVSVDGGDMEIHAFYAPRGSGFVRVDGWFYECAKRSTCGLVAMTNLGLARNLKSYPAVTFEAPYLLIKSTDGSLIQLKLKE